MQRENACQIFKNNKKMKKHIITYLLFFIPLVAGADDHCTNPDKYTVDKRCYVTEEQKTQKPYNSVVQVIIPDKNGICTGTIVKEKDGVPYLFTAQHCVWIYGKKGVFEDAKIKLENGDTEYDVAPYAYDKVYNGSYITYGRDWIVYKLPEDKKEDFLKIATERTNKNPNVKSEARLVGYGDLKIMSDEEIMNLKNAYKNYLENKDRPEEIDFMDEDSGIYMPARSVVEFLGTYQGWKHLTNNYNVLKVSFCKYGPNGGEGCQGWGGNSGGPVFDNSGKIMAIAGRGGEFIGGTSHAAVIKDTQPTKDIKGMKASIKINDVKLPQTGKTTK